MSLSQLYGIPKKQDNFLTIVKVNGGNGHGSTGTKVRCFTNLAYTNGSSVTYLPNTILGDSFFINNPGIFAISCSDQFNNGNDNFTGITLNATVAQLTVDLNSMPTTQVLDSQSQGFGADNGNSGTTKCAWMGWLNPGDVIRVQDNGVGNNTNVTDVRFCITQVMVHI